MSTRVIVARPSDDIFQGATITSTVAPMTSYDLLTLLLRDPACRVRFNAGTVTITWTLDTPARLDVFVLPVSNLDEGYDVASLTNGSGLNVPVIVPPRQLNNIPRTCALDVTEAEANATTRTSTVFNLVISGNSANVILGGAAFGYGQRRLLDAVQWGFKYRKRQAVVQSTNEYLSRYRVNLSTNARVLDCRALAEPEEVKDLEDHYDDCRGAFLPGLLWPQLAELDAYIGTWEAFEAQQQEGKFLYDVAMQFEELSKGKPVW